MRLLLLGLMIFLFSCASPKHREYASVAAPVVVPDLVPNHQYSFIKLFPAESAAHKGKHLFYIEIKNSRQHPLHLLPENLRVEYKSKPVTHTLERLATGRYTILASGDLSYDKDLKFYLHDKILEHQLGFKLPAPAKKKSKIEVVEKHDYEYRLRLTLLDEMGVPIELQQLPEIMYEGHVELRDLRLVRKGIWEFSLIYPEENHIFYISVRANGVLLERLYRFQHIEK